MRQAGHGRSDIACGCWGGPSLPKRRGLMFAELLDALDQTQARHDRLLDHIRELVPRWSLAWLVDAIQALRGYRLINAVTVAAEIGFSGPRPLMAFLGAVPSEHSTAAASPRPAINAPARLSSRPPGPIRATGRRWRARHRLSGPIAACGRAASFHRSRSRRSRANRSASSGTSPTPLHQKLPGKAEAPPSQKIAANKKADHHPTHRRCIGLEAGRRSGESLSLIRSGFRPALKLSARQPRDGIHGQVIQPTHQRSINRSLLARFQTSAPASHLPNLPLRKNSRRGRTLEKTDIRG